MALEKNPMGLKHLEMWFQKWDDRLSQEVAGLYI
jgi:hypothetical protein